MLTCSCSPRALRLGWHIVGFYQLYWVSTSFWSSKSASRGFVKGQWFIHFVPLIWAKRWGINLKAIQCFGRVSAPFPRSFLSSCQITAGLHLLNPPPWIFTSLAALSQVLFSPCEFSRIGMWRDVPAATAGRFMKTALCSTYTCNELNPPGSFIHSLFQNLSEPLNQITAFTQLRITPDVCQSDILSSFDEEREKKRRKGSFLYQKWSIPSLHQQNCVLVVMAVVFLNFDPFYSVFYYKDKVKNIWHFWWQLLSFSCHRSLFLSLTSVQTEKFCFDHSSPGWKQCRMISWKQAQVWILSRDEMAGEVFAIHLKCSFLWIYGLCCLAQTGDEEGPKVSSFTWNAALLETCPKSLILQEVWPMVCAAVSCEPKPEQHWGSHSPSASVSPWAWLRAAD